MKRALLALGATLLTVSVANAQQQIQWKQVTNLPKGLNVPQGMKLDILGIALGDSYAETKTKLLALKAEAGPAASAKTPATAADFMNRSLDQMSGEDNRPPLDERTTTIRYPTPGGQINGEFVGQATLRRELPNGNSKMSDTIVVLFSAPSSGAQVYAVRRNLSFGNADQPRVVAFLKVLNDKLGGAQPQPVGASDNEYRYQFDGGQLVAFNPPTHFGQCAVEMNPDTRSGARNINSGGQCDVSLRVSFRYGISKEHAESVELYLSDQERAKANKETDYAFMEAYVRGLQSQTQTAPPKL